VRIHLREERREEKRETGGREKESREAYGNSVLTSVRTPSSEAATRRINSLNLSQA
jgi:hypothetical protein